MTLKDIIHRDSFLLNFPMYNLKTVYYTQDRDGSLMMHKTIPIFDEEEKQWESRGSKEYIGMSVLSSDYKTAIVKHVMGRSVVESTNLY